MIKRNNCKVYFCILFISAGLCLNNLQSRVETGRRAFRFRPTVTFTSQPVAQDSTSDPDQSSDDDSDTDLQPSNDSLDPDNNDSSVTDNSDTTDTIVTPVITPVAQGPVIQNVIVQPVQPVQQPKPVQLPQQKQPIQLDEDPDTSTTVIRNPVIQQRVQPIKPVQIVNPVLKQNPFQTVQKKQPKKQPIQDDTVLPITVTHDPIIQQRAQPVKPVQQTKPVQSTQQKQPIQLDEDPNTSITVIHNPVAQQRVNPVQIVNPIQRVNPVLKQSPSQPAQKKQPKKQPIQDDMDLPITATRDPIVQRVQPVKPVQQKKPIKGNGTSQKDPGTIVNTHGYIDQTDGRHDTTHPSSRGNPSSVTVIKPTLNKPTRNPIIVSSGQPQTVQTMDLVLQQAGNMSTRNDAAIKKELEQYIEEDGDGVGSIDQLGQRLVDAHYGTMDPISANGALVQHVAQEDTRDLLQQRAVRPLMIQEEKFLYTKTAGIPFRLLCANLHLVPPVIHDTVTSLIEPLERAKTMGKIVMKFKDQFDVIVVQEAWDKTCRDGFYHQIKSVYTHKIEDNYQSYLATLQLNVVLGSGLAVYSKYRFETITTPEGKEQNYVLEAFSDNRRDGVFAHKGFLLVKIIKEDVPVYIVTTHLQPGQDDWDNYISKDAAAVSSQLAVKEMEQIKSAIRFTIMHDYYGSQLAAILQSCKTTNSGVAGFFNQYVINMGKKVKSAMMSTTLDAHTELQCAMQKITDFTHKQKDFWTQAYIFVTGNFGIGNDEPGYQDILRVFGQGAETIIEADQHKGTVYSKSGTPVADHRVDHIFSIGKKTASAIDGSSVGGSYVSDIFSGRNTTNHLALGFFAKLLE